MAIEFISWALGINIPTGPKFVLVALSNRANQDGQCWPSQKDIAAQTGQSERTVREHLTWLAKSGLITKKRRKRQNGSFTSDLFQIQRQESPAVKSASGKKTKKPVAKSAAPETSLENKFSETSKVMLPDSLDKNLWAEYRSHRSQMRKSLTPTAEKKILDKLSNWQKDGCNINEIIKKTLENGWVGLFNPEEKKENFRPERTQHVEIDLKTLEEWRKILLNQIGQPNYINWIMKTEKCGAVLYVETEFKKSWITNNFLKDLLSVGIREIKVQNNAAT